MIGFALFWTRWWKKKQGEKDFTWTMIAFTDVVKNCGVFHMLDTKAIAERVVCRHC
jgi:hypothetical protein